MRRNLSASECVRRDLGLVMTFCEVLEENGAEKGRLFRLTTLMICGVWGGVYWVRF